MLGIYGIVSLVLLISYIYAVKTNHSSLKSRVAIWFIIIQIIFLTCIMNNEAFKWFMMAVALGGTCEIEYNRRQGKLKWGIHLVIAMLSMVIMIQHRQLMYWLAPIFIISIGIVFFMDKKWVVTEGFTIIYEVFIITYGCMAIVLLHEMESRTLVLMMFLIQANDIAGYFVGSSRGRHYPFKSISPNKSVEGYISGLFGVLFAVIVMAKIVTGYENETLMQWGIIAVCFYVVGNLGDLLFSAYKRKLGIKDFSKVLKAHGGLLDRLDDVLTLAPIVYLLITNQII